MQLQAKDLLEKRLAELKEKRDGWKKPPGIALIWVGKDKQTEKFINAKKELAKKLNCEFFLHHFDQIDERHLMSVIENINNKKEINGIVLQLPLPNLNVEKFIAKINPEKDIDGLTLNSKFTAPTPAGIIALLKENDINLLNSKTVIIGNGKLVGKPLGKIFQDNNWPFEQINDHAESHIANIKKCNLIISCTGVPGIISPTMVTKDTIIVDGSGVDVDIKIIEPLAKAVTPTKGAIGPLTVSYLFENLLSTTD